MESGGHRVLGRSAAPGRHRGDGYDHFEVFVDDASRLALAIQVADERGSSAAFALETAAPPTPRPASASSGC